jgi:hypothetical protein
MLDISEILEALDAPPPVAAAIPDKKAKPPAKGKEKGEVYIILTIIHHTYSHGYFEYEYNVYIRLKDRRLIGQSCRRLLLLYQDIYTVHTESLVAMAAVLECSSSVGLPKAVR